MSDFPLIFFSFRQKQVYSCTGEFRIWQTCLSNRSKIQPLLLSGFNRYIQASIPLCFYKHSIINKAMYRISTHSPNFCTLHTHNIVLQTLFRQSRVLLTCSSSMLKSFHISRKRKTCTYFYSPCPALHYKFTNLVSSNNY